MDPEFITQDGSMSDAKMKNADVSLVGTGIAWETSSATQPHSDEYVPMLPLAGPNGDRYIRATMKSSFIIATSIPLPPLVSIPKWLCVGRITSLPMTFLSSLTGAPTVWR